MALQLQKREREPERREAREREGRRGNPESRLGPFPLPSFPCPSFPFHFLSDNFWDEHPVNQTPSMSDPRRCILTTSSPSRPPKVPLASPLLREQSTWLQRPEARALASVGQRDDIFPSDSNTNTSRTADRPVTRPTALGHLCSPASSGARRIIGNKIRPAAPCDAASGRPSPARSETLSPVVGYYEQISVFRVI